MGLKQNRELLKHVRGLKLVELNPPDTCCGFGGTFSVKFPMISSRWARPNATPSPKPAPSTWISLDSSCLLHILGLLDRQGKRIRGCTWPKCWPWETDESRAAQTRNPKPETRMPKEIRNPKSEPPRSRRVRSVPHGATRRLSDFGLRVSFGFRVSDFGFDPPLPRRE